MDAVQQNKVSRACQESNGKYLVSSPQPGNGNNFAISVLPSISSNIITTSS